MNKSIDQLTLRDSMATAIPLILSFLTSSKVVSLILLSSSGRISYANPTLAKCLKVACTEVEGQQCTRFLTEPDGNLLIKRMSELKISSDEELLLNFVDSNHVPLTLRCRFAPVDNGYLLIGEPPQDNNQNLQEELIQLNNQLSVLSRENIRKGRELARALANLKSAQSLLVHQEKMASLGKMTAGIAHEINNPLAFVLGNEQVLKRDFDDIMAFINTFGDALPEIATLSPRIHAEIVAKAGEIDLEYLAETIPGKIAANIEGLERVKNIVLDLRNFSRLDEAEQKYCNLAEGIQTTLRFLGPLVHEHGVIVETDFGSLPQLFCSPGPLNQAISNILVNAIQASHQGQTIRVSTHLDGDRYCVEVIDQGDGIPAELLTKVFDPFFTTKPVGSGTGLGLSIAHQIVAAHEGEIEIDSILGSGTIVRVLLPGKQQDSAIATDKKKPRGAK